MRGTVLALTVCMLLMSTTCMPGQDRMARPTSSRLLGYNPAEIAGSIQAYARSLGDSGFVTELGAGDQQRLLTCWTGRCGYGPLAVIQPRAHVTDSGSTARDSGDIIARIINQTDTGYLYRTATKDTGYKFNLHARDTVYWWAGRRGDSLVSYFVSTRRGVLPMRSDLVIDHHPPGYWKQPLARWLWRETDEESWATCDGGACCKSRGIPVLTAR